MIIVSRRPRSNHPGDHRPASRGRTGSAAFAVAPRLIFGVFLGLVLAGCQGNSTSRPTTIVISGGSATLKTTTGPGSTPTPTSSGSVAPLGACRATSLDITLTPQDGQDWQAGTGHRLAVFTLKNAGPADCRVRAKSQPMLVNGDGSILIAANAAPASDWVNVAKGAALKTTVQTSNLCTTTTLVAPLRIAFVMPEGDTIIAMPGGPTDMGADPGCPGDPGTPSGAIEMQPWAP